MKIKTAYSSLALACVAALGLSIASPAMAADGVIIGSVKDAAKAKKFAGVLHHVVIAMLLVAGGVSMSGLVTKGSIKGATLKGALNAIKAKEIRSFLITSADALV